MTAPHLRQGPPKSPLLTHSLTGIPGAGTLSDTVTQWPIGSLLHTEQVPLGMSKPTELPALAQFVTATAGRNMTRPAYVAVVIGVLTMVLLTVDPAYNAAHHWVDAVLWACLAFFVFEWVVRVRHAVLSGTGIAYLASARGLLDAACALAVPLALTARRQSSNRLAAGRALGREGGSRGFRACGSCAGCWCWNPDRC